jgi:hypothetical protein
VELHETKIMAMRSAKECLAKAASMELEADHCDAPSLRADLLSMAQTWREVAQQALWQDRFDKAWPA